MNSCYFHTCGGNVSPRVAIRYRGKIHSCSEVNVYWRKFHRQANVPDSLLYTQFVVFMWLPSTRWVQWCNHITYENNTAARPVVYQYMYILCLANIHICSNTTKWLFNLWRMSAKKHYRSIKMITQLNWGKGKELGEEGEKEKKRASHLNSKRRFFYRNNHFFPAGLGPPPLPPPLPIPGKKE